MRFHSATLSASYFLKIIHYGDRIRVYCVYDSLDGHGTLKSILSPVEMNHGQCAKCFLLNSPSWIY